MHELSIAQSLVELIEDELASRLDVTTTTVEPRWLTRVGVVTVKVGALSGVVPEALASAFPVAVAHASFRGATLFIDERPVIVHCTTCRADRELASPQRLCCPVCNTATPDVIGGRELELVSIEVLDDVSPNP